MFSLVRALSSPTSGLEAEATNNWATYMQVTGRLADAAQYWQKSVPLARSLGHRQALGHGLRLHGLMRFWKSEYHAAEAMGYEAVQVAAEVRDGFNLPLAHFYLGLTLGNLGKISEAMAALQESLDFARRNDHGVALARAPNGIGWLWREIGDVGKAIECDAGSVEVARSAGLAEAESNALANLVYDYIAAGELGKAAEALEAAYAVSIGNCITAGDISESDIRLPQRNSGLRSENWTGGRSTPAFCSRMPQITVFPRPRS